MSGKSSSGSWKLDDPDAGQAQGIVVSGFDHLPVAEALFFEFAWGGQPRNGKWLGALRKVAPVTAADGRQDHASVALGITAAGLALMGLDQETLGQFAQPFREGMFEVDRMRRLYDRIDGEWTQCVQPGGPLWSGNIPAQSIAPPNRLEPPPGWAAESGVVTPKTVHAVVIVFAKDERGLKTLRGQIVAALGPLDVNVVHSQIITLSFDDQGQVREHFGFADGLSQPIPWDKTAIRNAGEAPDPWNGIALGDLLLGHVDSHHETTSGPMVSPHPPVQAREPGSYDPDNPRNFDLGRNGTYLVVRELLQDVAGFWNSLTAAAAALGPDPSTGKLRDGYWLGEKVIGRSMKGDVLRPGGTLPRRDPKVPDNSFGYFDDDRVGLGCPAGSHMRRGNPRDGLATLPKQKRSLLASSNSHRFLRRGRKFGPKIANPMKDDGKVRGMMFLVINADIERQFEFVQQTWMMNPAFAAQFNETDPLVGPASDFIVPAQPVRLRTGIENHVKLAGGEYFFAPSLPALDWLERLDGTPGS